MVALYRHLALLYPAADKVYQIPDDGNEQDKESKGKQYCTNWHQTTVLYNSALGYSGQTIPNPSDDEADYNQYNTGD
jgi:hypothetical protein